MEPEPGVDVAKRRAVVGRLAEAVGEAVDLGLDERIACIKI